MDLPDRQPLPHDVPLWIDPGKEIYYMPISCDKRGINQLATPQTGNALLESVRFRQAKRLWFAYLFLVMPDHVHGLFSFPASTRTLQGAVSDWKRWTARKLGVQWQKDFFEHRLRDDESARAKSDYILANPVRAELVPRPEDWPYVLLGGVRLRTERG
jgi:hypothetical protein